jgi:hypothetical protein
MEAMHAVDHRAIEPSRPCPPRTRREAWPACLAGIGADAVDVTRQLGPLIEELLRLVDAGAGAQQSASTRRSTMVLCSPSGWC